MDAQAERLRELIWQWIIDSGDLIQDLEESGFPCPDALNDEVPR
jgi:hypothetical protein